MKFDRKHNLLICCMACFETRTLQDFRRVGTSPVDGLEVYRNQCKRCDNRRPRSDEAADRRRIWLRERQRRRRASARVESAGSAGGLSPEVQGESAGSAGGLSPEVQGESAGSAGGLSPIVQSEYSMGAR